VKTILLLRHGKSDWDVDYGGDHERPLNERGRSAAALVGRYLSSLEQVPDLVVTSIVRSRRLANSTKRHPMPFSI